MSEFVSGLHKSEDHSQPQFSAILTPYRSLSPRGFLILMSLISGISFAAGVVLVVNGAWPVVVFLVLDIIIIFIAFRMNYRSGKIYETVDLIDDQLIVTRVLPTGHQQSWNFNPYWVRLVVERKDDESARLVLSSHDTRLVFGSFLLYEEKLEFAEALREALFKYRGGTRI